MARGRQHLHLLHRGHRNTTALRGRVVAHATQVQQVQAAAWL